jgi:phthiodiolone/phenolphthiodiolone dimycocerosates ketoreductase
VELGLGVFPTVPLVYADQAVHRADEAGLDAVFVPDRLMAWFAESVWPDIGPLAEVMPSPHTYGDPFPLIAKWASETRRLRFVTAVTDPIRRPPAQLAVTALTMSHVTEGRFILGIGCGEALNCRPYGLDFDAPVARLDEALTIIRRLWGEGRVSQNGRFWPLRDAITRVDAYDDAPPELWIGAHGPRSCEIAGRHGDAWLPFMPFTPDRYAERLGIVRASAERSGRDPMAVRAALNTPVCIAEDHDRAHAMIASAAARQFLLALNEDFFTDLHMKHPLGIRHGVTDYIPEWLSEAELRAALARIPDPSIAHDHFIHGTPEEVLRQLEDLEEAGLQYFAPLDTSPFTDISQLPASLDRVVQLRDLLAARRPAAPLPREDQR